MAINIKKKYLENLLEQLKNICVFNTWEISVNEYEEMFDEIIDSQRKLSLEEKKHEIIVNYHKNFIFLEKIKICSRRHFNRKIRIY